MGHTHYWDQHREITPDEWAKIKEQFIRMLSAVQTCTISLSLAQFMPSIAVRGWDGDASSEPTVSDDEISFNGDISCGESCETFRLERKGSGFNFCKTRERPYDLLVCATLVAVHYLALGAIVISTDSEGVWRESEEWALARELHKACAPRKVRA